MAGADGNLVNDIFDAFDADSSGSIEYTEFVTGLAQFSDGDKEDVLQFIFSLHSATGDHEGSVEVGGVHRILSEMTMCKTQEEFTPEEVKQIEARFVEIAGEDGLVDKHEFAQAFGLAVTPFIEGLFNAYDDNGDGQIEAKEFVSGLMSLAKGSVDDKLRLNFLALDPDGTGDLEKEEVESMLKTGLKQAKIKLTEENFQLAVATFMEEADKDGDNRISYDEFREVFLR